MIVGCGVGVIVVGLDAENVRRLKLGQPIVKDLAACGGEGKLVIHYGATLEQVQRDFAEIFPDARIIDTRKPE